MLPTDVTTGIKPHQEKKGIWKAQKKKSNQISRKWVEFEFPIFLINDPKWMNSKLWNFFFDFVYLVGRHPFDRKFVHPRLWWRCRRKRSVQSRRQPKSASRKSCAVSFSMESNNSDNNDTITVRRIMWEQPANRVFNQVHIRNRVPSSSRSTNCLFHTNNNKHGRWNNQLSSTRHTTRK